MRDVDAIRALAEELGEVDIVFSNATARMSLDADPADQVDNAGHRHQQRRDAHLPARVRAGCVARWAADRRRQRAGHARQAGDPGPSPLRLQPPRRVSTRSPA